MDQGHRRTAPRDETRQGIYAATADGQLLGSGGFHPDAERTLRILRTSLERFVPSGTDGAIRRSNATDARYTPKPPAGTFILNVFTRIPLPQNASRWNPNNATGRDRMWILRDEITALRPTRWVKGERATIPRSLAERLLRFHLVDNVRGEPDMWSRTEIAESELNLFVSDATSRTLKLTGHARMEAANSTRGFDARIQGVIQFNSANNVADIRLLSWGEARGSGTYTGGAPPGRFPLVIAFSLAGSGPMDLIPPQAARWLPGYLNPG